MSGHPQICPACFETIPADARICPACGADLDALWARPFPDKLVAALDHPLSEVRLRAILALGWRGDPAAAQLLAACALSHGTDLVEGLAAVEAIAGFGAGGAEALRLVATSHPARGVRAAANRALDGNPTTVQTSAPASAPSEISSAR